MVKAGMNSISFYIPWDFHEYEEGKFDFTGTVDQDGDGRPDYPSRDILTFLKLIEERGIKRMMLRPGPYVNAEWGFLGFGAVPEWFHDKHPESHMLNSEGLKTKLYDYHNPDFLKASKNWFEELNRQVLSKVVGKDKPGIFLQLDNETNFQWQSIYNHDYGDRSIERYRDFLKISYPSLSALNQAQGTSFKNWKEVSAPTVPNKNLVQDQDWYRFQDWSIYTYLKKVRGMWEDLGVKEPNVLFTLAESFNAPKHGLLPNYKLKNEKGKTGLMTVNIYPKTFPSAPDVLFHQPFKSDYDLLAISASNRGYLGSEQEAVIGPEIHTGWFGKTVLSKEARQQTYLTLLGRGLKAPFFYYFHEGYNWQVDWGKKKILPFYEKLHSDPRFSNLKQELLPNKFWNELQKKVDQEFMVGWNVKDVLTEDTKATQKLFFDAPIDADGKPTKHFPLIEEIGQKIVVPYGEFLGKAVSIKDKVALIADSGSLVPSQIPGIDSRELHSDFAGGLTGYILQTGLNPTIHHWGINSNQDLAKNKIIFVQDSGNLNPKMITWLGKYISSGGTVVNFIGDSLAKQIGAPLTKNVTSNTGSTEVAYQSTTFEVLAASVSEYLIPKKSTATPILFNEKKPVGYDYKFEKGHLIQLGAVIHNTFNTGAYAFLKGIPERLKILEDLMTSENIKPQIRILGEDKRIVVFGRKAPKDESLWLTVKSGNLEKSKFHVQIAKALLDKADGKKVFFEVKNILENTSQIIDSETLVAKGFPATLEANGSASFLVTPLPR